MFQVDVFCIVTPCNVVVGYQCFRGPCCLHLQGEVGIPPQHYTASQPRRPRLEIYNLFLHMASFLIYSTVSAVQIV
jgi:hypothetical protein